MQYKLREILAAIGFAAGITIGPSASADLGEAATNPVSNLVQFRRLCKSPPTSVP